MVREIVGPDLKRVSFAINLGSALEGLPKRSDWNEKRPPSEAAAHLRARLGELIYGRDHWWEFDGMTVENAIARELIAALREVGLPWLDARTGLDRVLDLITTKPDELGWHDLRALPKLLAEAGQEDAADAVQPQAALRGYT